jgi:hypothetical protein
MRRQCDEQVRNAVTNILGAQVGTWKHPGTYTLAANRTEGRSNRGCINLKHILLVLSLLP